MKALLAGALVRRFETDTVWSRGASWRRLLQGVLALALVGVWLSGCYTESRCEYPTGPCVEVGGPAEAAVTAVAAGTLWATAGGCEVAGCRPPLVCNTSSGFCNYARCDEGGPACPPGTRCEVKSGTCR